MANQLVKEIMLPFDMMEVSINDSAASVSERVLRAGRSAIVEVVDQPFAILSPRSSRRLLGRSGPLRDYYQELTVTGMTVSEYPVERLVESMRFDTNIDAFIVMEATRRLGIVPVRALFEQMRLMGKSYGGFVDPPPPSDSCYCCPCQPAGPSHQVQPNDAMHDPHNRVYRCPMHRDWLILKQPCTNC